MASIGKTIRLALVLIVIGAGITFFLLNRNVDPRFYRFLKSDKGRAVADIMGWSVDFELEPVDRPESEMTSEEVARKRELEQRMVSLLPQHRLVLDTGEQLFGEMLGHGLGVVGFVETFGDCGIFFSRIREDRVLRVDNVARVPQDISYRDVHFSLEFSDLEFYREPPYTIMTDQNHLQIRQSMVVLQRMYGEFMQQFTPLITRPDRGDGIQLLFFVDELPYLKYQRTYAPRLEHTSGFYSPRLDRLIVYNQISSRELNQAKERLARQEKLYRERAKTEEDFKWIENWQVESSRSLAYHAEQQTRMTLRHEGAHQLFFTLGIHSVQHAENSWLIEGLACYCETAPAGAPQPERLVLLKQALREDRLIPLDDLLNSRSPRGLYAFWDDSRVRLAYAQSWALSRFLMRPLYREKFFEYIRYVRNPLSVDALVSSSRMTVLADALGIDEERLDAQWHMYLRSL